MDNVDQEGNQKTSDSEQDEKQKDSSRPERGSTDEAAYYESDQVEVGGIDFTRNSAAKVF